VNGCHFCRLLGFLVDAMVHYAEDELDNHSCYDKDAENLMCRVEIPALGGVSARPVRILV
jgi:hypothetical protein